MHNGPAYIGQMRELLLVMIVAVLYHLLHFLANLIPLSSSCCPAVTRVVPAVTRVVPRLLAYLPTTFYRYDDMLAITVRLRCGAIAKEWVTCKTSTITSTKPVDRATAVAGQGSGSED